MASPCFSVFPAWLAENDKRDARASVRILWPRGARHPEGAPRIGQALRLATVILLCLHLTAVGCAILFNKQEKTIEERPINCATAQGDLRILQHEKAHLAEEVAMGVTAI
jgi:hypothetical protein